MNHTRNIGILIEEEQEKIVKSKIAILGVGLGSVVAELAVRTGFTDIIIADGDTVSESNLNRQIYVSEHIGMKKAHSLKSRLEAINPDIKLTVIDSFIEPNNIPPILSDCDVIIDTIDLSSFLTIKAVHEFAKEKNIPVVFPINLGWKSMVTVFNKKSGTLESLIGIDDQVKDSMKAGNFETWARFLSGFVPEYGLDRFKDFINKASSMDDWCPAPQIGITVFATASLVVMTAVRLALGHETVLSPDVTEIDLFESVGSKHR